ncbi:MAG: methyltransferase [Sterolibacterium sp.]|nr:methyltransferase [Sterolibacterium sp.]
MSLEADGLRVTAAASGRFPLVLLLPPRSRAEARTLLARGWQHTAEGGVLLCCQANNAGARSGESDLSKLLGAEAVHSLSKQKCRVYWAQHRPHMSAAVDQDLLQDWLALDVPQPIAEGRFLSRPGLFAWDRIDAASALLARHLPSDLAGQGADLGAGFGYLTAEVLQRCPAVTGMDLYEAEARGLDLARQNLLPHVGTSTALAFFWHDVTTGLLAERRYDFIISNPPFHHSRSRADAPDIGHAFVVVAAASLRTGGSLWLVANQHLPYEALLHQHFRQVQAVCVEQGFKVIAAVK